MASELRDSRDFQPDEDSEQGFDFPTFLLDPLAVLQRRWRWMLPAFVVGLVGTFFVVAQMPPVFAATAKVLISKQQIPIEFVRPTVVDDPLANINAIVGQTMSKSSLIRIIEQFDLYPNVGEDSEDPTSSKVALVRANTEIQPATRQGQQGESLVYDIIFVHGDPEKAAGVANALSALMIEESIERRGANARRTTEFLRKNLQDDERELEAASRAVSDFRRAHRGTLPTELETSLRKVDTLSDRRESISARIASTENMITTLAASGQKSHSETLLEDLRRQLARETAANTDEHPNVIALRQQIARLEEVVGSEGGRGSDHQTRVQIDSERREIAHLREQLAATDLEITALNERIDQIPKVAEELAILEQKESAQRESHREAMRKVSEAQIAENLELEQQGSRVTMLDHASVPDTPERNRLKYLLAGLLASIAMSVGLGFLLEIVDPIVVDLRQLEAAAGGRSLGAIPRVAA